MGVVGLSAQQALLGGGFMGHVEKLFNVGCDRLSTAGARDLCLGHWLISDFGFWIHVVARSAPVLGDEATSNNEEVASSGSAPSSQRHNFLFFHLMTLHWRYINEK